MKQTKKINKFDKVKIEVDTELIMLCKHCKKPIDKVKLLGFSLICPLCGKPQNGEHLTV